MIRILLADDHALLRDGLRKAFEEAGDTVVGEASNGEEAVNLTRALKPEVIVMDISMPVMNGIEATRKIVEENPAVKIAMLTMHEDVENTQEAINAGAKAYITKGTSFSEVRDTILRVVEGDTVFSQAIAGQMFRTVQSEKERDGNEILSHRQIQILQAIADGMSTKQTGRHLGITTKTVHNHLNAIYRKLDAQSLTHAVLGAVRLGIIDLHPEDAPADLA